MFIPAYAPSAIAVATPAPAMPRYYGGVAAAAVGPPTGDTLSPEALVALRQAHGLHAAQAARPARVSEEQLRKLRGDATAGQAESRARRPSRVSPEERQLLEMGFHLRDVRVALEKAGGDVEKAVTYLF